MTDRRSSTGIDRRASARISMVQHDEDDYDLEAMGISDGFRPPATMTGHYRIPSQASSQGRRTPPPRPSSTTKPRIESFALRHDGGMGPLGRNNSIAASHHNTAPTRSSSVSTDMPYIRAESPYQGPSGPSHPYQMYPQESRLARTMSIATTSTVPVPDRPYNGSGGPTHPYGMYPQNIVPEGESSSVAAAVPPVPAGFPGLNNSYRRRLGPEGEEIAGIIGPDGHTEELPPYTQYPDEAVARKTRPTVQVPVLPGAGGIGLATRNPEFEPEEDLNTPHSRHSARSITSDGSHQINMAAAGVSEKPPLKKWQVIAKRKVCDIIPIWAIALAAIVFVLFAIILGTVLAVLKPKHPKHNKPDNTGGQSQSIMTTTTMTTTFDATPLSTAPPGLPTLPIGTFGLPIAIPSLSRPYCIDNPVYQESWSCSIPMQSYNIEVQPIPGATTSETDDKYEVILTLGNNTFGNYYAWGVQPPTVSQQQVLKLVIDSQDPAKGPAWFFQVPYNKLVIIPEDHFPPVTSNKRNIEERGAHAFGSRKGTAEPGDKPYFCYWNGTLLETFIYVNLSSSASRYAATTSSMATATPTSKSGASSSSGTAAATTSSQSSGSSSSDSYTQVGWLPAYPKALKIEERRIPSGPQSIAPYCVQQRIDAYGNAAPYILNGKPVIIYLNESDSSATPSAKRSSEFLFDRDLEERGDADDCACAWNWS